MTIQQCKEILTDVVKDEKKIASKRALFIIPDSSMFDTKTFEKLAEE